MIDVEAIAAYTAAVIRARREYAAHPFGDLRLGPKPERRRKHGDGCHVTVWDWRPAGKYARRDYDPVVRIERRCGQPVERYDLCAKHADDKERLQ